MGYQTDNERTCDNCGVWKRDRDFPSTGRCPFHGDTSAGYYCPSWIKKSDKPSVGPSEIKPDTTDTLDVGALADRIVKMKPKAISIEFVQRRLRCAYSEAALVIEELKRRNYIK